MKITLNLPINPVSFGQCGYNLLMAAKEAGHDISFFPIGDVDISTIDTDEKNIKEISLLNEKAVFTHSRENRAIKLWHLVTADYDQNGNIKRLNPTFESFSNEQSLISFYELDSPSLIELNVARNFDTIFTSQYTCDVFAEAGVKTRYVPLGFDKYAFKPLKKKYFDDDRIVFGLFGKFENRKHHVKIIKAWTKRFGNDRRYYLQAAIYNPFFNPQMNDNLFRGSTDGKHFWNVNFLQYIPKNAMYNDFLNSNNIVIAMSGGEGWGLPEFHAIGLGKHGVVLNAHAYKGWANSENSVLINPLNKIPVYDGLFFKQGIPFNQGNIFSFDDDEFIAGCEEAIRRFQGNPENSAGLKLQDDFTYAKTLDAILNNI